MDRFARRERWYEHHRKHQSEYSKQINERMEVMRDRFPSLIRSKYETGGEVPFPTVWRAVLLEFIATLLFVFFACGSVIAANSFGIATAATALLSATAQGFAIATLVYAIAHTSGGHINPAVTFALMISNNMGIVRGCFYIFAQLVGGICGAALLFAVTEGGKRGNLGTTITTSGTVFQGLVFEFIITFALIFTIFGTAINKAGSTSGTHSLAPLPIGFAVLIGVVVAYSATGGSMNPARTLGPAVISGTWTNHWIYWIGPLGAALVVGLLERYVLLVIPPARQPKAAIEKHNEDIEQGLPTQADAEGLPSQPSTPTEVPTEPQFPTTSNNTSTHPTPTTTPRTNPLTVRVPTPPHTPTDNDRDGLSRRRDSVANYIEEL